MLVRVVVWDDVTDDEDVVVYVVVKLVVTVEVNDVEQLAQHALDHDGQRDDEQRLQLRAEVRAAEPRPRGAEKTLEPQPQRRRGA